MDHIRASIDRRVKEGLPEDYGFFLEGKSGYAIADGTAVQVFKYVSKFAPYQTFTVHKIIPYEKGKGILREVMTGAIERAEAPKKIASQKVFARFPFLPQKKSASSLSLPY